MAYSTRYSIHRSIKKSGEFWNSLDGFLWSMKYLQKAGITRSFQLLSSQTMLQKYENYVNLWVNVKPWRTLRAYNNVVLGGDSPIILLVHALFGKQGHMKICALRCCVCRALKTTFTVCRSHTWRPQTEFFINHCDSTLGDTHHFPGK